MHKSRKVAFKHLTIIIEFRIFLAKKQGWLMCFFEKALQTVTDLPPVCLLTTGLVPNGDCANNTKLI